MKVLKQYQENGMQITEYTVDGISAHAIVKQALPIEEAPEYSLKTIEQRLDDIEARFNELTMLQLQAMGVIA
jgi:hypothetical protein